MLPRLWIREQRQKIRWGRLLIALLSGLSVTLLSAQATKYPIRSSVPMQTFSFCLGESNAFPSKKNNSEPLSCHVPPGNAVFFHLALFCIDQILLGTPCLFLDMASTLHCSRLWLLRKQRDEQDIWLAVGGGSPSLSSHLRISRENPGLGPTHRTTSGFILFCLLQRTHVVPTNFNLILTELTVSFTIEIFTHTSHILELILFPV